ncbi:hypothetical protein X798_03952 [Onchocerca flexuosa]|uniref:Uncharacterized protein n=1 Tax=Onchocerca flexuosa TaxID=387005 RepID=A0A238BUS7_9BILA|nr:hypothetical protein X798_03952 [Onchocerca flexuosa]
MDYFDKKKLSVRFSRLRISSICIKISEFIIIRCTPIIPVESPWNKNITITFAETAIRNLLSELRVCIQQSTSASSAALTSATSAATSLIV